MSSGEYRITGLLVELLWSKDDRKFGRDPPKPTRAVMGRLESLSENVFDHEEG
jgi:hypothetical protein